MTKKINYKEFVNLYNNVLKTLDARMYKYCEIMSEKLEVRTYSNQPNTLEPNYWYEDFETEDIEEIEFKDNYIVLQCSSYKGCGSENYNINVPMELVEATDKNLSFYFGDLWTNIKLDNYEIKRKHNAYEKEVKRQKAEKTRQLKVNQKRKKEDALYELASELGYIIKKENK